MRNILDFFPYEYATKNRPPKKNDGKNLIFSGEIELKMQINAQSVDNFVVHYLKMKYLRNTFEGYIDFDQKPLKFDIGFTRNFVRKIFSKTI